jgi:DNA invertase Pin-like site-specific DNA recombinase
VCIKSTCRKYLHRGKERHMALIGYARVSTGDQTLDLQRDALREAGCIDIYEEEVSGARVARTVLAAALRACRPGDTFVIWKLDRLGRNASHLIEIAEDLARRDVALKTLTGFDLDTRTAHGRLLLQMFAALAEYERSLIQERIMAGIAAAWAQRRTQAEALCSTTATSTDAETGRDAHYGDCADAGVLAAHRL